MSERLDDAWIEKAAKGIHDASPSLCDRWPCDDAEKWRTAARAALSAVVDDIRAAAWDEGFDVALQPQSNGQGLRRIKNPYSTDEATNHEGDTHA